MLDEENFYYWDQYFLGDPPKENDDRIKYIYEFMNFVRKEKDKIELKDGVDKEKIVSFMWPELLKSPLLPSIGELMLSNPQKAITCLEIAIHTVFKDKLGNGEKITVRIFNYDLEIQLRNLKSSSIGNFICLRGTVVRASNIKPRVVHMDFTCARCGARRKKYFTDGKFSYPTRCTDSSCRSRSFIPDRRSAFTIDWQRIRIQEIFKDDQYEAGRIPRTIEIELTKDLVDKCVPGDLVVVNGIVKAINTDQMRLGRHRKNVKALYFLYLDANSIFNTRQQMESGQMDIMQFSVTDLKAIRQIALDPNVFHLIVNSICPAIYGHEIVKAGLALCMFGGCEKYTQQKNKLTVRGDPHCLVVGDPGLGKSQLLTAVSHIVPRGVYVCGNTTSTSGLTVTVVRDSHGDFSLEAGALVLADQGVCCIDEFDKMKNEHQALLEAMEQQSISIAKAGMVCNLPARCSVIAAANPVGGHFSRAKTVSENLKISPALLSRFDLVFILLDRPDEKLDRLLSEHVMKLHSDVAAKQSQRFINNPQLQMTLTQRSKVELKDRLKVSYVEDFEPLPPLLLRKYIGYAKKYCKPKLSPEACDVLQTFYISLRKNYHSPDSVPITTRQLESLIRLAQARAKIELREEVTEQDALDVVDIMKESLYDMLTDEKGQLDFRRTSGSSKSKEHNRFISILQVEAKKKGDNIFTSQELYTIFVERHFRGSFENFLDVLNQNGYLLKKGGYKYQLHC